MLLNLSMKNVPTDVDGVTRAPCQPYQVQKYAFLGTLYVGTVRILFLVCFGGLMSCVSLRLLPFLAMGFRECFARKELFHSFIDALRFLTCVPFDHRFVRALHLSLNLCLGCKTRSCDRHLKSFRKCGSDRFLYLLASYVQGQAVLALLCCQRPDS